MKTLGQTNFNIAESALTMAKEKKLQNVRRHIRGVPKKTSYGLVFYDFDALLL